MVVIIVGIVIGVVIVVVIPSRKSRRRHLGVFKASDVPELSRQLHNQKPVERRSSKRAPVSGMRISDLAKDTEAADADGGD